MTGTPYTTKDFSASNNPEIAPEVVEAAIKLHYHKNLIGRNLLDYKELTVSTTSTVEEEDTAGDVNWLSENGSLPKMDFSFTKETKRVRPYGGYFEVSEEQQDDGMAEEIRTMIKNVGYAMSAFEDLMVFGDIVANPNVNSVDAKHPWDVSVGTSAGDPIFDLGAMRRAISQATKGNWKPDTLIMSELTFGYFTQFDAIKSRLYNTQGADGYIVTGEVPRILGMSVIIDDAVDPTDAGQAIALKEKDLGVWEERKKIQTRSIPGYLLNKDNIAFKYTAKAKGEPSIKNGKLACLIEGLYTT